MSMNMELLKQHVAILSTALKTVNTVTESLALDATGVEADMAAAQSTPSAEKLEALREENRLTYQRLVRAKYVIEWLMKGGGADPCSICAKKCKMGEECKPVWKEGADL